MDRRALGTGDLIGPPPPTELTQAPICNEGDMDEATDLSVGSSAKIDQLMHLLRLTPEDEKSLVFSQFTTFLDKVGPRFSFVRSLTQLLGGKRSQKSLMKKGQYIFTACSFLNIHLQLVSIGYLTSDSMAGCPQSGGKKR
jgi:hypothetical protein